MLSPETLEQIRQMTPGERLRMTVQMSRENMHRMFQGTEAQVRKRFEVLRKQNDERNRNMLIAIARTR